MSSTSALRKPDYGIDAPGVVRNLALMGLAGLAAVLAGLWHPSRVGILLCSMGAWFAGIGFLEAGWMVWGSRVGKLRQRESLLDRLGLEGTETALDVGCGRGLLLNGAARRLTAGRVVGLDLWRTEDQSGNDPAVTLANAEAEGVLERVQVTTGDMRAMPFGDGNFDAVLSSLAIHNIPTTEGRVEAVREIARVTRPGGRVALQDFVRTGEYGAALRELGWQDVEVSRLDFRLFPPVRTVTGTKPESESKPSIIG